MATGDTATYQLGKTCSCTTISEIKKYCAWLAIGWETCYWGAEAYQLGNTSSRTITEVKQR